MTDVAQPDQLVSREVACEGCGTLFLIMVPSTASGKDICQCPFGACAVMLELDYDQQKDHPLRGIVAEPPF